MANGGRGNNYVSVANEWVWQFVGVAHWLMRVGVERFSSISTYKLFLLTNFHVLEKNNR